MCLLQYTYLPKTCARMFTYHTSFARLPGNDGLNEGAVEGVQVVQGGDLRPQLLLKSVPAYLVNLSDTHYVLVLIMVVFMTK